MSWRIVVLPLVGRPEGRPVGRPVGRIVPTGTEERPGALPLDPLGKRMGSKGFPLGGFEAEPQPSFLRQTPLYAPLPSACTGTRPDDQPIPPLPGHLGRPRPFPGDGARLHHLGRRRRVPYGPLRHLGRQGRRSHHRRPPLPAGAAAPAFPPRPDVAPRPGGHTRPAPPGRRPGPGPAGRRGRAWRGTGKAAGPQPGRSRARGRARDAYVQGHRRHVQPPGVRDGAAQQRPERAAFPRHGPKPDRGAAIAGCGRRIRLRP